MAACSMCKDTGVALIEGICSECRDKHKIPEPVGMLRPPEPCGRCGHMVLVAARLRERASKDWGEQNDSVPAPMAVTYDIERKKGWLMGHSTDLQLDQPFGLMVAYICRRCGFTEIYTREPQAIPIGEEYATELIDLAPDGEGPYR